MDRREFLFAVTGAASHLQNSTRALSEPLVEASLTVHPEHPGRSIPEDFAGLSYETSVLATPAYFSPNNLSVLGLVRGLAIRGVLRLGGNSSEHALWRVQSGSAATDAYVITPMAIDALAAFLDAADWRLIYGLNLGRGTPKRAADEAAYVAHAVGARLMAFQIGNEPDGFGRWSGLRPASYDVHAFLAEWRQYATAIRRRVPDAPFAGPAIAGEAGWLRPFVESAPPGLVLITRHYYADGPARAPHVTLDRLLGSAGRLAPIIEEMGKLGRDFALPFRMSETNSIFMEGHPGVSDTFASALWGLELMLQVADAGGTGVNFHAGDARAYTPIGPGADGRHTARPLYYGLRTFEEMVRDATALVPARLSAPRSNMAAYAARTADGGLKVCLINKEANSAARVAIDAGRAFTCTSMLRLAAPSLEAKVDVTLGGAPIDDFGRAKTLQTERTCDRQRFIDVPAASAVLVELARE